ncbi:hypothetical protein IPC1147_33215 [Pseudomonas aeruginosa]|uniref:hypothetical protein n=1 Tax=Pseudomonas aeruginosa TaxID=287 RepID=UPI000FFF4B49|nr:hypothetical protein [Pseudomonas aeruginosa]MBA5107636.1 hypothetical protein [Pseudomonas aeruginosa]MBD1300075.1 hypothetical protein [Pseudomonas aeruginosa]MBD1340640.1 hypothetical protein [Pseudomonas aeruginosa]MCO2528470.1 hypothetical protein [Pseudomonas aeruginosa]MCO2541444.1 hypothetical protein [Pseudomonas aeruginosa]
MQIFQTLLISAICSVLSVVAYDQFLAVKPTPVAVANYDLALETVPDANEALSVLRSKAALLAAEGYVVIDSRALLGYPGDVEIPREALLSAAPAADTVPSVKGNAVTAAAVEEMEKGGE